MSRDDVLAELLDPPRRAYVPLPDTRAIERPGWRQLITPSVPQGLNQISLAQLDDDDNLDATIDAAISEYGGRPFVWRVGPDSRPADLGERLLRRGLRHDVSYGMARSTNLAASEGDVMVELVDRTTADAFTTTMAAGWNIDAAPLAAMHARILEHGRPHYLWLARIDGEPVATAASVVSARSVYLIGGVTVARFRGHGAYRALVAARLAHARAQGISLATSIARADTSAPILERLGFERVCRFDNYVA
jgi:GNAT superfamily N-acetyltransferase